MRILSSARKAKLSAANQQLEKCVGAIQQVIRHERAVQKLLGPAHRFPGRVAGSGATCVSYTATVLVVVVAMDADNSRSKLRPPHKRARAAYLSHVAAVGLVINPHPQKAILRNSEHLFFFFRRKKKGKVCYGARLQR